LKVAKMKTTALSVPMDYPFSSPFGGISSIRNPVIVQLTTDEGLEAFGICNASDDKRVASLKATVDDLGPLIIGQDVARTNEAWQKLWKAAGSFGHASGYPLYALSAIDNALWVLKAKMLGLPLATLLGGFREKVPAYASHLLFRDWTVDRLQKDAAGLVKQGFKAMKMRMGTHSFDVEVERYKAVRQAVGKDIAILVDCNWAYSVSDAIRLGRMLEGLGVYWFEDPLASEDPDQIHQVSEALDMPVTSGETWSTKFGFRTLFEKRAADIYMIDVMRVGGVTEWIRVANMAQAQNLRVCSHMFNDISCHLVASVPNGLWCEYIPWWDKIFRDPPQVKDGFIEIPKEPGIGLEIDPMAFKKWEMK
jgi:L-alanine-DL-glutamate epimerase-like enolase superfamily enzyme